jgi:Uma2 family endonuclease
MAQSGSFCPCYNVLMLISTKFTHADLLAMPDDGKRREIVEGELFVTPSPNLDHQRISRRIELALANYLEAHPIGEIFYAPIDVILSDFDVLEPDLLIVLNEHREILKTWVEGTPDLVVEILSSTTANRDRGLKLKAYARHGVTEYWIVDPDQRAIEVYRLGRERYRAPQVFRDPQSLTSSMLPNFSLSLADVFKSL